LKTIYLIDDDAVSNYISKLLILSRLKNIHVKSYESPIVALENILKAKTNSNSVILLDLNMPEMNGYEFIEKINENGIDCPVIILTNSKNLMEKEYACKFKQVKAFFSKPISQDNIELFYKLSFI
jgi:CheY-like chemotaxis protein